MLMSENPSFVLMISCNLVCSRLLTFDPPAAGSQNHHSTTPSERPTYRLSPYPSTHLTSIFWSAAAIRRSAWVRSGEAVPRSPVVCGPDGEAADEATAAALLPAAAAIEVAEENIEVAADCGGLLAPGVGDDGPEHEHFLAIHFCASLPESDKSSRSGAWYRLVNMEET